MKPGSIEQLDIFSATKQQYKITKPIRLIELFAGVGSQAMALKRLGADFEHYRVVEFDKYAIKSYNAIHGTDFEPMDITKIIGSDLGITDTDKYCYIMTYSFPCQDLNAKNYGVAQNRNRCFMVSILGDYTYDFPNPIPLKKTMKDYLEDEVEEKYYINNEKAQKLIQKLIDNGTIENTILDRQTDRQTGVALTEQSANQLKEKLQTVSRQDMTVESQTNNKLETWLLKDMGETADKQIDVAVTLRARDYKGLDNYGSNGVIEWKN